MESKGEEEEEACGASDATLNHEEWAAEQQELTERMKNMYQANETVQEAASLGVSPAFAPILDKMNAVVKRLLVEHADPASISVDELLTAIKRNTPASRRAASDGDVMELPGILSAEACATLRTAVDRDQSMLIDTVDGGPEHQLTLSRDELERLLGGDVCRQLWKAPCEYHRWRRAARAAAWAEDGDTTCAGSSLPPVTDVEADKEARTLREAFVRRYSMDTRPFIPFHPDAYELTVNIALSSDEAHSGGQLIGLFSGQVRALVRREGDATVHSSQLLHAVSRMTSGVRYSLILVSISPPLHARGM
jgi:hypothetical protein